MLLLNPPVKGGTYQLSAWHLKEALRQSCWDLIIPQGMAHTETEHLALSWANGKKTKLLSC